MSTIAERLQRKRRKEKEDEQLQHEEEADETIKEKKVMKIELLDSPPKYSNSSKYLTSSYCTL